MEVVERLWWVWMQNGRVQSHLLSFLLAVQLSLYSSSCSCVNTTLCQCSGVSTVVSTLVWAQCCEYSCVNTMMSVVCFRLGRDSFWLEHFHQKLWNVKTADQVLRRSLGIIAELRRQQRPAKNRCDACYALRAFAKKVPPWRKHSEFVIARDFPALKDMCWETSFGVFRWMAASGWLSNHASANTGIYRYRHFICKFDTTIRGRLKINPSNQLSTYQCCWEIAWSFHVSQCSLNFFSIHSHLVFFLASSTDLIPMVKSQLLMHYDVTISFADVGDNSI